MEPVDRMRTLLSLRKELHHIFREYDEELQDLKRVKSVSAEWVTDFARHTTLTLTAPKMWVPGVMLIGAHPPAPQPEQMRDSILQQFNLRVAAGSRNQEMIVIQNDETIDTKPLKIKSLSELAQRCREKTAICRKEDVKFEIPSTDIGSFPVNSQQQQLITGLTQENVVIKSDEVQPMKRQRQINISFGLSDSESSSDEES
jgi:antitoxin component of MazEF toxin-antitoxin module